MNRETSMSDSDEILRQVEQRKQRARDLGVDKLLSELYFDHGLRHYSAGMHHQDQRYPIISDAQKLDDNSVRLTMNGKNYVIAYRDKSSTFMLDYHGGDLELSSEKRTLICLSISEKADEYVTTYEPFDITAFIEGDWIKDFQQLREQVLERAARWERDRKEKLANELKEKFGL